MTQQIGTKPNQTPTNADLGTAAQLDIKDVLLARGSNMSAIEKVLGKQTYFGFVYDTSKDSDGGAWRNRCQHTSWYNEELNTYARGSRREFPSVALIVSDSSSVWIYDADDPDLPLWMMFSASYQRIFYGNFTGIKAVNGALFMSQQESSGGTWIVPLQEVNFIKDKGFGYPGSGNNNADTYGMFQGTIADRNYPKTYDGKTILGVVFARKSGNSLDIRVMKDAPIDPETGLPKPSVAVGCGESGTSNGGVSIFVNMEHIFNIKATAQGTDTPVGTVAFLDDHTITFAHRYAVEVVSIRRNREVSSSYYNGVAGYTGRIANGSTHKWSTYPSAIGDGLKHVINKNGTSALFTTSGLSLAKNFKYEGDDDGVSAHITTKYNTGWMPRDIRIATLCDTKPRMLVGLERVTNGSFTTDISGWTAGGNTTLSHSNSRIRVTNVAAGASSANQSVWLREGVTYQIRAQIEFGNHYTAAVNLGPTGQTLTQVIGTTRVSSPSSGIYHADYVATTTGEHTLQLYGSTSAGGYWVEFDNISIQEAVENYAPIGNDRINTWTYGDNYTPKLLQVYGEVPVTRVASDSQVVAYGPFDDSNDYLRMPYSDLIDGLGTDDFCAMFWVNYDTANANTYQYIWEWAQPGVAQNYTECRIRTSSQMIDFYVAGQTNSLAFAPITPGIWNHVCMGRKNQLTYMYVNGQLGGFEGATGVGGQTGQGNTSITNGDGVFTIGQRSFDIAANNANQARIAMFRFAGSMPSGEQIKEIYYDERTLFTAGSQSCLYGTTDEVKDANFDASTGKLYAGTTDGISVFEGLRRVDENDSNGITHYVVAANDLVAGD